jgi:hypothetical protein
VQVFCCEDRTWNCRRATGRDLVCFFCLFVFGEWGEE